MAGFEQSRTPLIYCKLMTKTRFVSSEIFVHRHSPTPPDDLKHHPPPKKKVHKQILICPRLEGNTYFSVNDVRKNSHIIFESLTGVNRSHTPAWHNAITENYALQRFPGQKLQRFSCGNNIKFYSA